MQTLEDTVLSTIEAYGEKLKDSQEVKEFVQANKSFELLVKKGLVSKRGNHTLVKSEAVLHNEAQFNKSRV